MEPSVQRSNTALPAFVPTTPEELKQLGWSALDVILVTGDTYIDAPHIGVAVIARVLLAAGYRVGIIAQPDIDDGKEIMRLGEPELFWGVSGGSVDSMVANFTPSGRRRKSDDMTPGGRNTRRPDRAVLAYSHLIRRHFKQTRPIVLGGIEASLRRISHYDAWSEKVRRSILFDAKADYLLYGMAEESVAALAQRLKKREPVHDLRGLCYIARELPPPDDARWGGPDVVLPSHAAVYGDPRAFARMFTLFYDNADPTTGRRLFQQQDTRYLIQNPPPLPPAVEALDAVYELPFTRDVHPYCLHDGAVPALETIRFSLTTHRGCFGECRFCAITVHQGRQVVSRSAASIEREATALTRHPAFKGIISDAGGPTANMYGMHCRSSHNRGACTQKGCLFPHPCKTMRLDHQPQIELLRSLRRIRGVRKVFVASGLRYDLILADQRNGARYLEELLRHHISGQLKIAPEHIGDTLLRRMGKPGRQTLEAFIRLFDQLNRDMPRRCFLTYYFMAAYPGCTEADMIELRSFAEKTLRMTPEQVQIFTPTPSTYATLMYCTGIDPFTGETVSVEKSLRAKVKQKALIVGNQGGGRRGHNERKMDPGPEARKKPSKRRADR
jgi:uncharacterized radical SAM protein YgiQ